MKKRINSKIKSRLAVVLATFLSSCGSDMTSQSLNVNERGASISGKLPFGRRISYTKTEGGASGLLLADGTMSPMQVFDTQNGSVVWLTNDSPAHFDLDADLIEVAQNLLRHSSSSWGISTSDLAVQSENPMTLDGDRAVVHFSRSFDGLLVRDAYFDVVFSKIVADDGSEKWSFREVMGRHAGPITIANSQASCAPEVYFDAQLGSNVTGGAEESSELILPHEYSVNGDFTYSKAVQVTGNHSLYPGQKITATFACGSGEVLEAFSDHTFADARRVLINSYIRNYMGNNKAAYSVPGTRVSSGATAFVTDNFGWYADPAGSPGTLRLDSARGYVVDQNVAMSLPIPAFDAKGEANLVPEGNDLVGANAFMSVQRINSFVRRHLTPAQAGILNARVKISINVDGSCNAFYTGTTVNFYPQADGCANTALVNDVVYHEWGHGLDDYTGRRRGITDGAFSEGIGDINAAYMVGDSNMSPGFTLNSNSPLRRLKNQSRYPQDRGEVHDEGQIIGGAFWDLRVALVARYGAVKGAFLAEEYFYRHLLTTDAYVDSYQAVITLDDNDGNPATRSPNFCLITAAFAAHGLATAVANCNDAVVADSVKIDADLAVEIAAAGTSGVMLMASSRTAKKVGYCLGTLDVCKADPTKIQALKLDGAKGSRILFTTPAAVSLAAGSVVSILTQDPAGAITGGRSVKIMSR